MGYMRRITQTIRRRPTLSETHARRAVDILLEELVSDGYLRVTFSRKATNEMWDRALELSRRDND